MTKEQRLHGSISRPPVDSESSFSGHKPPNPRGHPNKISSSTNCKLYAIKVHPMIFPARPASWLESTHRRFVHRLDVHPETDGNPRTVKTSTIWTCSDVNRSIGTPSSSDRLPRLFVQKTSVTICVSTGRHFGDVINRKQATELVLGQVPRQTSKKGAARGTCVHDGEKVNIENFVKSEYDSSHNSRRHLHLKKIIILARPARVAFSLG